MERGSCKTAQNNVDGSMSHIESAEDCLAAAIELRLPFTKVSPKKKSGWQNGCLEVKNKLYWNTHSGKEGNSAKKISICCKLD